MGILGIKEKIHTCDDPERPLVAKLVSPLRVKYETDHNKSTDTRVKIKCFMRETSPYNVF